MTAAFLDFSKSRGNDLSTPVPAFGFPGPEIRYYGRNATSLEFPQWQHISCDAGDFKTRRCFVIALKGGTYVAECDGDFNAIKSTPDKNHTASVR